MYHHFCSTLWESGALLDILVHQSIQGVEEGDWEIVNSEKEPFRGKKIVLVDPEFVIVLPFID